MCGQVYIHRQPIEPGCKVASQVKHRCDADEYPELGTFGIFEFFQ